MSYEFTREQLWELAQLSSRLHWHAQIAKHAGKRRCRCDLCPKWEEQYQWIAEKAFRPGLG